MAIHGALAAFNPQEEDWSEYTERLTFYFTANGITTDAKKRAVLLSCCGPATFRLLRSLVLPVSLDEISFENLVKKMKEHRATAFRDYTPISVQYQEATSRRDSCRVHGSLTESGRIL